MLAPPDSVERTPDKSGGSCGSFSVQRVLEKTQRYHTFQGVVHGAGLHVMSVHEFFRERTADFAYMYVSYLFVTFTVASRHAPCAVKWLVVGDLVK